MGSTMIRFDLKSYLELHPKLKKVMDVLFALWFGAVIITSVISLYGMNTLRAYQPDIYLNGFQFGWTPIIFTILFTIPVLLLYMSGGFSGSSKECGCNGRHAKMVEDAEKILTTDPGEEVDL